MMMGLIPCEDVRERWVPFGYGLFVKILVSRWVCEDGNFRDCEDRTFRD